MSNAIDFALGYNLAPMRSSGREAVAVNQGVMDRMSAGISGLGAQWQKFAGLAVVGFAVGAAKTLGAFASEIRDLSDQTGLSTDMFQRYSFAVSQSGGTQEVFAKGMIAIQQAQQSAITGNEKAIASFATLGITLSDLQKLSPDQLFLAFADAMKISGGSAESFAALAELVGVKVATKLVPALKLGRDGFLELGKSATVVGEDAINAAEGAQDAWDKFGRDVKSIGLIIFDALGDIGGEQTLERQEKQAGKFKAMFDKARAASDMLTPQLGPTLQDFQPGVDPLPDYGIGPFLPPPGPSAEEKAVEAERAKAAEDIYAIEQKIARLKLETGREQMSQLDLISSLEAERAGLLKLSQNMANSPLAASRVMAAQFKLQAEEVGNRIGKVQKNFQAGVATGEQFGPTLADLGIGKSLLRPSGGGATSKGGAGAGLWSSGGLITGARSGSIGLGRPSSITHRGGPQERMAGDMRELLTIWKRN